MLCTSWTNDDLEVVGLVVQGESLASALSARAADSWCAGLGMVDDHGIVKLVGYDKLPDLIAQLC